MAETGRIQDKREIGEHHDWIKLEYNVYETGDVYVEERLHIEPSMLQSCHPVVIRPKEVESTSHQNLSDEENSDEELVSSDVSAIPHTELQPCSRKQIKQSFICMVCEGSFSSLNNLNRHMLRHVTGQKHFTGTPTSTLSKLNDPTLTTLGVKSFNCTTSETVRKNPKRTGESRFGCRNCYEIFSDSGKFRKHIVKELAALCSSAVNPKPQTRVKRAKRPHNVKKPFTCDVCNRNYAFLGILNTHKQLHTGEKSYKCKTCDARFSQLGNLNTHMRIHTGEKPFNCGLCDAKFAQLTNLNNHMRTHTGEKPFRCTICNTKFSQMSHLNQHLSNMHTYE